MAFLIKGNAFSQLRTHSKKADDSLSLSRRGFHVEPGTREKALLEKVPALDRFKSYKKSVKRLKLVGEALSVLVVAGSCYEIYVKSTMREEARRQARGSV